MNKDYFYNTLLSLSRNIFFYKKINLKDTFETRIYLMFIHFSFAHLAFNCLWLYILGEKIEQVDGSFIFFLIVVFSSIFSNFLQFYWTDSSLFGGLSGVIYGLIGYCMILEMDSEYDRYQLPPALYLFMIIWLILGFLGLLDLFGFGSVANFAHLGGLVSGVIFAMICKTILKRT